MSLRISPQKLEIYREIFEEEDAEETGNFRKYLEKMSDEEIVKLVNSILINGVVSENQVPLVHPTRDYISWGATDRFEKEIWNILKKRAFNNRDYFYIGIKEAPKDGSSI